jgi:hypothetical protein
MSAREAENGFVQGRIVSSQRPRRNIRGENKNDFNEAKIGGFQIGNGSVQPMRATPCARSSPESARMRGIADDTAASSVTAVTDQSAGSRQHL